MKSFDINNCAMRVGIAIAFMTGCGNHADGTTAIPQAMGAGSNFAHHQTFCYTGVRQTFKVPTGVTSIEVRAFGATGGNTSGMYHRTDGGEGGTAKAVIPVTGGEKLKFTSVAKAERAEAQSGSGASTAAVLVAAATLPEAAAVEVAAPLMCARAVTV